MREAMALLAAFLAFVWTASEAAPAAKGPKRLSGIRSSPALAFDEGQH